MRESGRVQNEFSQNQNHIIFFGRARFGHNYRNRIRLYEGYLSINRQMTFFATVIAGHSKITWGHRILSFKQCGVIDAPHCFEAS